MAKYDKMNEANRQEREKKINLPLLKFAELHQRGISVSDLSKNTGLSKGMNK